MILVGLVGGGFTFSGSVMPTVGKLARVLCFSVGGVLLIAAIALAANELSLASGPTTTPPQNQPPPTTAMVEFIVSDELPPGQLTEEAAIVINGEVIVLNISTDTPYQERKLSALPGPLSYTLNTATRFSDGYVYLGAGEGTVNVAQGKRFVVACKFNQCPVGNDGYIAVQLVGVS